MYLLDSNIVSGAMAVDKAIVAQLTRVETGGLAISCVTLAEILYGLLKLETRAGGANSHVHRKQELFRQLMDHIDVLPWIQKPPWLMRQSAWRAKRRAKHWIEPI